MLKTLLLLLLLLLQLPLQLPPLLHSLPQVPGQRCHLLAHHHQLTLMLNSLPASLLQLLHSILVLLLLMLQLLLQSRELSSVLPLQACDACCVLLLSIC